jgi:hypothetical protein
MSDMNGGAEDSDVTLSPISPTHDWWPPLQPRHINYHRFFDIDRSSGREFIGWLEEKVPNQPHHTRSTFVFRQGLVAVSSSSLSHFDTSRTMFVFSEGVLELFRKFVNDTGIYYGLVFKCWRVSAIDIRALLRMSEVQLNSIRADHQFFNAVFR